MTDGSGTGRRFLFLQGPHGPFFRQLGSRVKSFREGARVVSETAAAIEATEA